jgi:hypothetical protein
MAHDTARAGTDNITQTEEPDTLTVLEDTIQPTDFFDGAGGFDTIVIGAAGNGITADLSAAGTDATHGFHHYEALAFRNTSGTDISIAKFAGDQFGTDLISTSLAVRGVNGTQQDIAIETDSNFSAARWTFTNWEKFLDFIEIFWRPVKQRAQRFESERFVGWRGWGRYADRRPWRGPSFWRP